MKRLLLVALISSIGLGVAGGLHASVWDSFKKAGKKLKKRGKDAVKKGRDAAQEAAKKAQEVGSQLVDMGKEYLEMLSELPKQMLESGKELFGEKFAQLQNEIDNMVEKGVQVPANMLNQLNEYAQSAAALGNDHLAASLNQQAKILKQ